MSSLKNIFLMLVLFAAKAANSQYFAPVGTKWHYNSNPLIFAANIGYHLFEVEKDTLLNGLSCSKIVQSLHYNSGVNYDFPPDFVRYENNKVYYYKYGKFRLLYDFTLEIGDTLHFFNPEASPWDEDTMTHLPVDTIIQVEQDGKFYKTYYFDYENPVGKWYIRGGLSEIVGGTYWLFPSWAISVDYEPGGLRCYQDSALYINLSPGDSTACDFTWTNPILIGLPETEIGHGINIFPNPANDFINVSFVNGIENEIALFDVLGNTVPVGVQSKNNNLMRLNVSGLPKGLYLLKTGLSTHRICIE